MQKRQKASLGSKGLSLSIYFISVSGKFSYKPSSFKQIRLLLEWTVLFQDNRKNFTDIWQIHVLKKFWNFICDNVGECDKSINP